MSKLNNIYNSYGKSFGMAIANTYSYNVLTAYNLPKNTIIISAPNEETYSNSMIVTDSYGIPIRLTYNILPVNGIIELNGNISLEVNNDVLYENTNGELSLDKESIIDNETIIVNNEKLRINTQNIENASSTKYGVVKVDGNTIVSENGTLHVDTSKLDYSNNSTNTFGTIRGSETLNALNGILSVNTENLEKSSYMSYGILKPDNDTVISYNGILSVNINSFRRTSSYFYGISKVNDNSIYKSNENVLKINYNALRKASYSSFGILMSDEETTTIENGVLSIKNYSDMQQNILLLGSTIEYLNSRLNTIETNLNNLTPILNGPHIFTLVCDGLSSVELTKPEEYGEYPEEMEVQKISATFIVNTNCPFKISLNYIDNISPAIELYEINYNDIDRYPGNIGLTRTYQSTDELDSKITFSWLCKNYRDTNNSNYSTKTKVILDVLYSNDVSINKEAKYSIVRFNSLYNDNVNNNGDDEILVGDENGIITPILNYRLQINDDNTSYFTNSDALLYGKHIERYENDRNSPFGAITTIDIIENNSYKFIGNNVNPQFISLYVAMTDDIDSYTYNRTLSSNDLSAEFMLNNQMRTNVILNTNNNNEINFTYHFNS